MRNLPATTARPRWPYPCSEHPQEPTVWATGSLPESLPSYSSHLSSRHRWAFCKHNVMRKHETCYPKTNKQKQKSGRPVTRGWRGGQGAAARCRRPASRGSTAAHAASPGKGRPAKFRVWFLLNANHFHTTGELKTCQADRRTPRTTLSITVLLLVSQQRPLATIPDHWS